MTLQVPTMRKQGAEDVDGVSCDGARLKPLQRLTASPALVPVGADDAC